MATRCPWTFAPGTQWSYSNTGYVLLGVLVHKVTGRFYGDVLQERVFAPLGMTTTRVITEADIVPNRAAGYRLVDKGELKNQEWVSPSLNTTADGSLYLTVLDLAKWDVALNHRRLPDAPVLDAAWAPVRLNDGGTFPYGYGWDLSDQRGHRRVGHTGSWQGFKTALYRYPEFDLSIVVLANLDQATPGPIAQGIAGILEPALQPPHLFRTALRGPTPRVAIQDLLQRVAAGNEAGMVAPGARRFLLPAARQQLAETLQKVGSWTALGCEPVIGHKIRWLGADAARICYARGTGRDGANGGHGLLHRRLAGGILRPRELLSRGMRYLRRTLLQQFPHLLVGRLGEVVVPQADRVERLRRRARRPPRRPRPGTRRRSPATPTGTATTSGPAPAAAAPRPRRAWWSRSPGRRPPG